MSAPVPHTGEDFTTVFQDPPITGETATRYWSGVTPRLEIRDASAGYARVEGGDPYVSFVVAYLAPFTFDPSQPLRLEAQIRFDGTWALGTSMAFGLGVNAPGELQFLPAGGGSVFGLSVGGWHDISLDLTFESYVVEYAQAGHVFVCAYVDTIEGESYEVSYLAVFAGRDIPLRLRQRGDGLGMGGPRLFGRGSRQRSPRARGYL